MTDDPASPRQVEAHELGNGKLLIFTLGLAARNMLCKVDFGSV